MKTFSPDNYGGSIRNKKSFYKPLFFETVVKVQHKKSMKSVKSVKSFKTLAFGENENDKNKENEIRQKKKSEYKKKVMIDMLDYDENYEAFNDFHYVDKKEDREKFSNFSSTMKKTKYVAPDSIDDFYKKYHMYAQLQRKGSLNKLTPSYAFIKATQEHLLIPNAVGFLRRKGDDNVLSLK